MSSAAVGAIVEVVGGLAPSARRRSSVPGMSVRRRPRPPAARARSVGSLSRDLRHLALVERVGGHQHLARAEVDARGDRLRAEGGEQRRDHACRSSARRAPRRRARGCGRPARTARSPLPTPSAAQHVGEAVGEPRQFAVADVAGRLVAREKAERGLVAQGARRMALHRLIGDVEPAARQCRQFARARASHENAAARRRNPRGSAAPAGRRRSCG